MFYSDVSAMRCEIHLARSRPGLVPTNLKMYNKMCDGDGDHNGVIHMLCQQFRRIPTNFLRANQKTS